MDNMDSNIDSNIEITMDMDEIIEHIEKEHANKAAHNIKSFTYGGIDGVITTFAIMAAAVGANLDPKVVIHDRKPRPSSNVVIDDAEDISYLEDTVLNEMKDSEHFLVHYLIENGSVDDRFQEILDKHFNSSIRKFYYYLVKNFQ